jgi:hypothetical protein
MTTEKRRLIICPTRVAVARALQILHTGETATVRYRGREAEVTCTGIAQYVTRYGGCGAVASGTTALVNLIVGEGRL